MQHIHDQKNILKESTLEYFQEFKDQRQHIFTSSLFSSFFCTNINDILKNTNANHLASNSHFPYFFYWINLIDSLIYMKEMAYKSEEKQIYDFIKEELKLFYPEFKDLLNKSYSMDEALEEISNLLQDQILSFYLIYLNEDDFSLDFGLSYKTQEALGEKNVLSHSKLRARSTGSDKDKAITLEFEGNDSLKKISLPEFIGRTQAPDFLNDIKESSPNLYQLNELLHQDYLMSITEAPLLELPFICPVKPGFNKNDLIENLAQTYGHLLIHNQEEGEKDNIDLEKVFAQKDFDHFKSLVTKFLGSSF